MLGQLFSSPRKRPSASSLAGSVEALEDRTLLSGSGVMLGDSVIIDNGGAGFSTSGAGWNTSSNGGFENDHSWNAMGDGSDTAEWTFSVGPGTYQIAITWLSDANRATNAPFTVLDGTTELETVLVNQEVAPDDLTADGSAWESIGEFTITSGTLTVRLTDAADEFVIADAVRVTPVLNGPEIQVAVDGMGLSDGGTLDLGQTLLGGTLAKTISVTNTGNEDLLLDGINVPDGFSLAQGFPVTALAAGETTSFVIEFTGTALGGYGGEVSFGNNDPDEGPFNFTVSATVAESMIIDNGDAGFSTTGSNWGTSIRGGYAGDHAFNDPGDGSETAEWTVDVGPGTYEISTTWLKAMNRATDATYTILDGDTVVGTVVVNQELDPGLVEGGWEILGQFTITSGTLTVRLTDLANDFVIADAVQITRVADSGDGGSGDDDNGHNDCVLPVIRDWQNDPSTDDSLGQRLSELLCDDDDLQAAAILAPQDTAPGRSQDRSSGRR